jgi:hypothetical protein
MVHNKAQGPTVITARKATDQKADNKNKVVAIASSNSKGQGLMVHKPGQGQRVVATVHKETTITDVIITAPDQTIQITQT